MKVAILGAVHGTSENERLIFNTYKAAVELKLTDAEIITPQTIIDYKNQYAVTHKNASENEVLGEMVRYDLEVVSECDLVLADVSLRSTGLGMELAKLADVCNLKNSNEKPNTKLLLFAKEDSSVSDMVVGAFYKNTIYRYADAETLAELLNKLL